MPCPTCHAPLTEGEAARRIQAGMCLTCHVEAPLAAVSGKLIYCGRSGRLLHADDFREGRAIRVGKRSFALDAVREAREREFQTGRFHCDGCAKELPRAKIVRGSAKVVDKVLLCRACRTKALPDPAGNHAPGDRPPEADPEDPTPGSGPDTLPSWLADPAADVLAPPRVQPSPPATPTHQTTAAATSRVPSPGDRDPSPATPGAHAATLRPSESRSMDMPAIGSDEVAAAISPGTVFVAASPDAAVVPAGVGSPTRASRTAKSEGQPKGAPPAAADLSRASRFARAKRFGPLRRPPTRPTTRAAVSARPRLAPAPQRPAALSGSARHATSVHKGTPGTPSAVAAGVLVVMVFLLGGALLAVGLGVTDRSDEANSLAVAALEDRVDELLTSQRDLRAQVGAIRDILAGRYRLQPATSADGTGNHSRPLPASVGGSGGSGDGEPGPAAADHDQGSTPNDPARQPPPSPTATASGPSSFDDGPLAAALRSEDAATRLDAILEVGERFVYEAADQLLGLAEAGTDRYVRVFAVETLAELGVRRVAPELRQLRQRVQDPLLQRTLDRAIVRLSS